MAILRTGMSITIGKFAQDGKHADPTPLNWIVLAVTGTKALLLSQYAIDEEPFHGGPEAMFLPNPRRTTWADSTIRAKLNGEFYEMHIALANGRFCGAKRPNCGAKTAGMRQ